jgi:hypothetical protein
LTADDGGLAAAVENGVPACRVSVILPVFNEERHLSECLESLLAQVGCDYEIIAVDDGSTDCTPTILRHFAARDGRLRVLRQDHAGPGIARNRASQLARGDILVFCDGDMIFAPTYLAKLVAPIERGETIGTFSREEYVANWDNVWARCWNLNDGLLAPRRHPEDWPDEHEVFRAVQRDVFLQAGGFTPGGAGDDRTLAPKIATLARVAPGAVCYHYNPETLAEVFSSVRWYARGQRIAWSWHNVWVRAPLISLKSGLKRALRQRLPAFIVFKLVSDTGGLIGLLEKRWRLRGKGR